MTPEDGPVAVLGSDGYTGWALTGHLLDRGYDVVGVDDFTRRRKAAPSVTPIADHDERARVANQTYDGDYRFTELGITDYDALEDFLRREAPASIVNLAQIPAAPYSMVSVDNAWETQRNNVEGALNLMWALRNLDRRDTHIVQLATMGEWGVYPDGETIPEGFLENGLPAPKNPGSLYHACYDDETEILTLKRGWVRFADLTGEERVATRGTHSRAVEFRPIESILEYDYDGSMYHQQNGRLDFRVTSNHRVFTQKQSHHEYKELRREWPEDIQGESRVFDVGLEWSGETVESIEIEDVGEFPVDDWLRFFGWYISEGNVMKNSHGVRIRQSSDSSGLDSIKSSIRAVADIVEGHVNEMGESDRGGLALMKTFTLHHQGLHEYLARYGKAADKYIPHQFKQLDSRHLQVLLETLIDGDGWHHNPQWGRDNHRYATISERLADDVQELALKCGYGATVRWDEKKEIYIVNICQTPRVHVNHGNATDGWEEYRGKVYCVEVSGDGIIFVRRNGKPVWSGNSKVNTTVNTYFLSETWDIPVSEIYQGIVYGLPETDDEALLTRFDVDSRWGTALNRFTAQAAVGEPLTVYGRGGQKRAMLPIDDCVRCLTLALENPPGPGSPGKHPYRAINQFDEAYRIKEIAELVTDHTGAEIAHLENPREEDDSEHFYEPDREVLDQLGYEPSCTIEAVFERTYAVVDRFSDRIPVDELMPDVYWDTRKAAAAPGQGDDA